MHFLDLIPDQSRYFQLITLLGVWLLAALLAGLLFLADLLPAEPSFEQFMGLIIAGLFLVFITIWLIGRYRERKYRQDIESFNQSKPGPNAKPGPNGKIQLILVVFLAGCLSGISNFESAGAFESPGSPKFVNWPAPTEAEVEFDHLLGRFSRRLRFSSGINPTAASQRREKQRFFEALSRGENYDPQFDYLPLPEGIVELAFELAALKQPPGYYGPLLNESRNELLTKLQLLQSRGAADFTEISARLYPLPEYWLIKLAWQQVLNFSNSKVAVAEVPTPALSISSAEMAQYLTDALTARGLKQWQVKISAEMAARASVLPQSRIIKVRADTWFSEQTKQRLEVHEIDVHVRRAEAGHAAPLQLFVVGLAGYLETEEGLAVDNEVRNGITSSLRLFALRLLAVHWARVDSFSKVFQRLVAADADQETAWAITLRVKRGLRDTARPGCYTRDLLYFRGYHQVSNYLNSTAGSAEHAVLAARRAELMGLGKTGLNSLKYLRRILK